MIDRKLIDELVDLLRRRGVLLFHACQLLDLQSYISIGGVPSRQCLCDEQKPFTPFDTDQSDREKGVWDKVFVNLEDFGTSFAKGRAAVPNPYGPVALAIAPEALLDADDVAICLRSAGALDFNRDEDSLSSIEEVERLFAKAYEEGRTSNRWIKFSTGLAEEFGLPKASSPEISVTMSTGYIDMDHVKYLVIDPYTSGKSYLPDVVKSALADSGHFMRTFSRDKGIDGRLALYDEIAAILHHGIPDLNKVLGIEEISPELREWIEQIQSRDLGWQFERFGRYLREGTLAVIPGGECCI